MSVDGQFSIWRSRDGGESWERRAQGLPKAHWYLREALATDSFEQAGIYAGTDTGQLFYSRMTAIPGKSWRITSHRSSRSKQPCYRKRYTGHREWPLIIEAA